MESRKVIPNLSIEIWGIIFKFMHRTDYLPFRRLSKEFSLNYNNYYTRVIGPTCGISHKQAFIPVSLLLNWPVESNLCISSLNLRRRNNNNNIIQPFDYQDNETSGEDENEAEYSESDEEFCFYKSDNYCCFDNNKNVYCLECAENYCQKFKDELKCPKRCCVINKSNGILYELLSRRDRDWYLYEPIYSFVHSEMDKEGVGLTKCPNCSMECYSIRKAIDHFKECNKEVLIKNIKVLIKTKLSLDKKSYFYKLNKDCLELIISNLYN